MLELDQNTTHPLTTSLCTACGLCCNGTMFHTVRLQPVDDPAALAALGLKLKRKNGRDLILQPCPAYKESRCSIYEQRPERCRRFECQQLLRVRAGELSLASALSKIRDVQRRTQDLDQLSRRADGSPRKGPIAKRCETALAEPFDATTAPELIMQREELARGLRELEEILDTDFRVPVKDTPGP